MGPDSTSPIEIAFDYKDEDECEKALTSWMGGIKKPKKGQKLPMETIIENGKILAEEILKDAHKLMNEANRDFAKRAIAIGMICLELKKLIRGMNVLWAVWAEENLPFIAKRNREKYMMLARRPDCWKFSFLGVDRLDLLCSVTKSSKEKDPICKLLQDHNIEFDETLKLNMAEFKTVIDAAINYERLISKNLTINFKLVTNIINIGLEFDKGLISRLKDIQDGGGDPEVLIKKLIASGGKDQSDGNGEKKIQDFDTLGTRLISTIDYLLNSTEFHEQISKDVFQKLMQKMRALQESANLTDDDIE